MGLRNDGSPLSVYVTSEGRKAPSVARFPQDILSRRNEETRRGKAGSFGSVRSTVCSNSSYVMEKEDPILACILGRSVTQH